MLRMLNCSTLTTLSQQVLYKHHTLQVQFKVWKHKWWDSIQDQQWTILMSGNKLMQFHQSKEQTSLTGNKNLEQVHYLMDSTLSQFSSMVASLTIHSLFRNITAHYLDLFGNLNKLTLKQNGFLLLNQVLQHFKWFLKVTHFSKFVIIQTGPTLVTLISQWKLNLNT